MDLVIWNKFCTNYDIDELLGLSKEIKEYIFNLILKQKSTFRGLVIVLLNYLNPVSIQYKIVSGFMSLHYLTGYGKKIYLFGEFHFSGLKCKQQGIKVSDFIVKNIELNPRFIDLFLEIPLIHKTSKDIKVYTSSVEDELNNITYLLQKCLRLDKKICNYPNLRVHYTDVRNIIHYESELPFINKLNIAMLKYFYALVNKNEDDKLSSQHIFYSLKKFQPKEVKEYKKLKTPDDFKDYFYKNLFTTKLKKQLDNIEDTAIRTTIKTWFLEAINRNKTNLISWDKLVRNFSETDSEKMAKILVPFIHMLVPYMDLYLSARMFRKFSEIKYYNSKEAINIIVYAGNDHINNYVDLLTNYLNFKHEYNYKSDENFCMDLSPLKDKLLFS